VVTESEFLHLVTDAYEHLYDIAHLLSSPLIGLLVRDSNLSGAEKARGLHTILLSVIDELDPGPYVHISSREWRRHRLVLLRYADGLDPRLIAEQLAISVRHYYREHKEALEAIAVILWDRYAAQLAEQEESTDVQQEPLDRRELVQNEAARISQANPRSKLSAVIQGITPLIQEMAHQKDIRLQIDMATNLPDLIVDPNVVRQILIELLSYMIGHSDTGDVHIAAKWREDRLCLALTGSETRPITQDATDHEQQRFSVLNGLAALSNVQIRTQRGKHGITGFELELPTTAPRTVLVVDDNEEVTRLFQSYLIKNDYRFAIARTGFEAISMASDLLPYAITLDVMIPKPDGWTVLQMLKNRLETRHIPVIVCTVLSAKELALSLGADAFLEKPVSEGALLSALAAMGRVERQ
jgi:CheY-like chemotaxis protein